MKKKNLFIFPLLVCLALLTSCLKDQEDTFDKSASARLDEYLTKAQDVLLASQNGWIMEYYPESSQSFGGYTYTMKFTKEEATICSELLPEKSVTSLYRMGRDFGPMITFDTYNPFLHFFATPSSSLNEGYQGDFEFVLDSISDELIKLHGKRSHNVMYLRRLTEDAQAYIAKVSDMSKKFSLVQALGTIGATPALLNFDTDDRQVFVSTTDGTPQQVAYNYTNEGIRLYHPLDVSGTKVSHIKYDDHSISLSADNVAFKKCAVNPQIITNVIKNIGSNDAAFERSFTLDKLNQFDFQVEADWLSLKIDGNTLTVSATENNTGDIRSASVYVISKINTDFSDSFAVSQCEAKDITGSYLLYFYNYENILTKVDASIIQSGDNFSLLATIDDTDITFPLVFDAQNASLFMQSGLNIGEYKGYGLIDVFFFDNDQQFSSISTDFSSRISFVNDPQLGTCATLAGQLYYQGEPYGYEIEKIALMACNVTPPTSYTDFLGYIQTLVSPMIVKVKDEDSSSINSLLRTKMKPSVQTNYFRRLDK